MIQSANSKDLRRAPRMKLPAMYTLVKVRENSTGTRFDHAGYIYDISTSGMRIELDTLLEPGTQLTARLMLPGDKKPVVINLTGWVVRHHDGDDEVGGPTRMGIAFEKFKSQADEDKLFEYLSELRDG